MNKLILPLIFASLTSPVMAQESNSSHCKKAEEEGKLKTGSYEDCVCFYSQVDKHLSASVKNSLMSSQLTGEDTMSQNLSEAELIAMGPKMEKVTESTNEECLSKNENENN